MSVNAFPQSARKPRAKYQTKYLIGAFLILAVIGYLIFFGISSTQQYYYSVGELFNKGQSAVGQGMRVGGNLVQSSIKEDIKNNQISFAISDGAHSLPISYKGVVPDTFDKATQVIAEGKLNPDGTFTASLVLAKCPSKYDASTLQWYSTADSGNLNYTTGK
jgi:cytochrome c-type biogenesis protein CcmE